MFFIVVTGSVHIYINMTLENVLTTPKYCYVAHDDEAMTNSPGKLSEMSNADFVTTSGHDDESAVLFLYT